MSIEIGSPEWQERVAEYDKKILQLIDEYGWAVQGVGAGDGCGPFAYTVGLADHGHPEFVIDDLSMETMQSILNTLAKGVYDGLKFQANEMVVNGNWSVPFLLIDCIDLEDLTMSRRVHGGDVKALQVVWPDKENLFFFEEGFDHDRYGHAKIRGVYSGTGLPPKDERMGPQ